MKDSTTKKIERVAALTTDSEKNIERYLVRQFEALGALVLKFTSSTQTGYPDRLIALPGGRCLWVEVKSTGRKPRALQLKRMTSLKALGHYSYIVDKKSDVDTLCRHFAPMFNTSSMQTR